jgi:Protein of unknown function (DUF4232)
VRRIVAQEGIALSVRRGALLVLLLITLLATACGDHEDERSMSLRPSSPQADRWNCTSGDLVLRAARMEGATGHMVTVFAFTNQSRGPCRMNGFPPFEVRDTNDRPVPVAVNHGSGYMLRDGAPSDVTLPRHGEAFFGVEWTSDCAAELGGGNPTVFDRVAAGAPGEPPTMVATPARVAICPGGAIGVGPVRASDTVTW